MREFYQGEDTLACVREDVNHKDRYNWRVIKQVTSLEVIRISRESI